LDKVLTEKRKVVKCREAYGKMLYNNDQKAAYSVVHRLEETLSPSKIETMF